VTRAGAETDAVVFGGRNRDSHIVVAKNRLEIWLPEGMASVISLPEVAPNVVISQNWLAGGSYTVRGDGGAGSITGNRFSARFSPRCGRRGTHLLVARSGQAARWDDNRWADGPSSGQEIQP
jgi:hypothetical protein